MRRRIPRRLIPPRPGRCPPITVPTRRRPRAHQGNPYFNTVTSTTEGSVTVEGNTIHYHAVAGLLVVHPKGWNDAADKGDGDGPPMGPHMGSPHGHHARKRPPEASMFYVAYFKDGEKPGDRPITFLYNGGPGSSTVWLHMGAFGPQRVVTADDTHTPRRPLPAGQQRLQPARCQRPRVHRCAGHRLLARRRQDAEKDFYGADQDVHAFSEFIMQFLSKYGRWNSPKYLFGESYGTPRSAIAHQRARDRGRHRLQRRDPAVADPELRRLDRTWPRTTPASICRTSWRCRPTPRPRGTTTSCRTAGQSLRAAPQRGRAVRHGATTRGRCARARP